VKIGRRIVIPRERFLSLFADDTTADRLTVARCLLFLG